MSGELAPASQTIIMGAGLSDPLAQVGNDHRT